MRVPVAVYTADGKRWQIDDSDATVEHVLAQLKKDRGNPLWLPVIGPLDERALAGWLRASAVVAVTHERSQP